MPSPSQQSPGPLTRTRTQQFRIQQARVEKSGNRNAAPILSDRVRKPGWKRKACLECHRRKVKCDMTTKNRCTSCEKLNVSCSVNEYRRRRNKEKRSKIDQLESGIERMENFFERLGLMRPRNDHAHPPYFGDLAALPAQDETSATWDTISESEPENSNPDENHLSMREPPEGVDEGKVPYDAKADDNSILGDPAYSHTPINPTSNADAKALPLHEGDQERTGNVLGGEGLYNFTPICTLGVPDNDQLFDDINATTTLYPLPGIGETMALFLEFLENFNLVVPIFEPISLLSMCDEDSIVTLDQADRWACVNVVLALSHVTRSKGSDIRQYNYQLSWMYMKNACHVVDALCSGPPTLCAAQALLGMAVFFLGILSSEPCGRLIASALRIIHQLLIVDSENTSTDRGEDLHHRRIVFWIAYCLDRDVCLRAGTPLGENDEDTYIEFSPGLSTHQCKIASENDDAYFDAFRSYCELSVIKGKIYKFLCSAATSNCPMSDLASTVATLDLRLREWKASVPKRYRPDVQEIPSFPGSRVAILFLSLHFSYFNCLLSIHRVIVSHGPDINIELARYSNGLLSDDIALFSGILCQNAARASIKLMKHMPGDNPFIAGILLHYLVVASTTLSKNIVHNPHSASGTWDINLIKQVECFLSSMMTTTPNERIHRVIKHCTEYRCLAESAVSRVKALSV